VVELPFAADCCPCAEKREGGVGVSARSNNALVQRGETLRIVTRHGGARRDRKCSLNIGRIPNVRGVRVALGAGYHPGEGNRRASRNGRERSPKTRNPYRSDSQQLRIAGCREARPGWDATSCCKVASLSLHTTHSLISLVPPLGTCSVLTSWGWMRAAASKAPTAAS
jgi:hypothetical protein